MVDDDGFGAGAGCDVGELKGDEPASDEQDSRGELFEVQERGGVDEVIGAGEVERAWSGAGGDQGVAKLEGRAVDVEPVRAGESRGAVQRVDAVASQVGFHVGGHRVGEAVHVGAERWPVDAQPGRVDALAGEKVRGVDDLGAAPQDLLRVAPAQCASAAVGEVVDDRDSPSGSGAFLGCGSASHTCANHDQVVRVRRAHDVPTFPVAVAVVAAFRVR